MKIYGFNEIELYLPLLLSLSLSLASLLLSELCMAMAAVKAQAYTHTCIYANPPDYQQIDLGYELKTVINMDAFG